MAIRPTRGRRDRADFGEESGFEDTVVKLYRCATVVKGGRRFSFGALVVVGDRQGQVGFGYGKANEVPPAVDKGIKQAKRNLFTVPLRGTTIPHRVMGRFGASRIMLIPAADGTGVIAGAAPRAVLELAGVKNVLTKCYGSTSPKNLVKATVDGLKSLRPRLAIERLRGVLLDLPPEPPPAPEPVRAPAAVRPGRRERFGPGRGERGPRRPEQRPPEAPPEAAELPPPAPEAPAAGPETAPPAPEGPSA